MKTPAQRQQALRDARKAAGLVLVRIWATKTQAKALHKFFAEMIEEPRALKRRNQGDK